MHLGISRHILDYNVEVHIIEVWEEGVNWILNITGWWYDWVVDCYEQVLNLWFYTRQGILCVAEWMLASHKEFVSAELAHKSF
jgi:hypothetical protein